MEFPYKILYKIANYKIRGSTCLFALYGMIWKLMSYTFGIAGCNNEQGLFWHVSHYYWLYLHWDITIYLKHIKQKSKTIFVFISCLLWFYVTKKELTFLFCYYFKSPKYSAHFNTKLTNLSSIFLDLLTFFTKLKT